MPKSKRSKSGIALRRLIIAALFASIIFVATAYLKLPIPFAGYVHLGDGIIFISASLLPFPFAIIAAALGASLADLMSGYTQYILATFTLKAITALCFSSRNGKCLSTRNLTAIVPAIIINAGGYYLFEAFLYKSFISPLAGLPFNALQSAVGAIIFVLLGAIFDKTKGLTDIFSEIR